jgi:hypothetical protein
MKPEFRAMDDSRVSTEAGSGSDADGGDGSGPSAGDPAVASATGGGSIDVGAVDAANAGLCVGVEKRTAGVPAAEPGPPPLG